MTQLLKQAAFAKLQGWHKSTVTRLKQAGRLVMVGGRVDVLASLKRIDETGGMRDDVAERHATERAQKTAATGREVAGEGKDAGEGGKSAPDSEEQGGRGETRANAQARKEAAQADLAEMEVRQKRGELIPKVDVDLALRSFAASVRAKLDVVADQIAPLVAPVSDLDEVHALVSEHMRGILTAVADDMSRAAVAAGKSGV